MTSPRPAPGRGRSSSRGPLSTYLSSSPIAAASIMRDLSTEPTEDFQGRYPSSPSTASTVRPLEQHSMAESYRRPSFIAAGPRPTVLAPPMYNDHVQLSEHEREEARNEERSLLRDNNIIPPKHPRRGSDSGGFAGRISKKFSSAGLRKVKSAPDEENGGDEEYGRAAAGRSSEETPLLVGDPTQPYGGIDDPATIDRTWESAVLAGKIQTTWQREAKTLTKYSRSLILTFLLQYSLTVSSIFTVGHIGKVELGAVSLASMTANITGYAVYHGLATSLDTLAAQAYGSGRKHLVGLQLQRMVLFLWLVTIPIACVWLFGTQILQALVPEKETARLAGLYLKILLVGAPGYAAFEAGKRFVQAQGLFEGTLYVLLICAPLNAFMNWFFVWKLNMGFPGAPTAVATTEILLPILLFLYAYMHPTASQCWTPLSRRSFQNWSPMIRLALPGLLMVLAEFLAFEILTLAAARLGTTHLAAQSILGTIASITYQIPFPVSIAASTRIANLIGATLATPAKVAAKVATVMSVVVGVFNICMLWGLKSYIPRLFSSDPDVIALVASVLPVCAAFQVVDALAACFNGVLRGLGRQEIGGYVNLGAYYVIGLPISFGTGFGLHWDLYGLWAGPAIGLAIVSLVEGLFIYRTSWEKAVEDAKRRNTAN